MRLCAPNFACRDLPSCWLNDTVGVGTSCSRSTNPNSRTDEPAQRNGRIAQRHATLRRWANNKARTGLTEDAVHHALTTHRNHSKSRNRQSVARRELTAYRHECARDALERRGFRWSGAQLNDRAVRSRPLQNDGMVSRRSDDLDDPASRLARRSRCSVTARAENECQERQSPASRHRVLTRMRSTLADTVCAWLVNFAEPIPPVGTSKVTYVAPPPTSETVMLPPFNSGCV